MMSEVEPCDITPSSNFYISKRIKVSSASVNRRSFSLSFKSKGKVETADKAGGMAQKLHALYENPFSFWKVLLPIPDLGWTSRNEIMREGEVVAVSWMLTTELGVQVAFFFLIVLDHLFLSRSIQLR